MHRAAFRLPLRHVVAPQRRSFVSTVLLTRAWENETVVELRREARKRGLPSTGNKATLIIRLKEDDHQKAFAPEPTPVASQIRHASTAAPETPTEVPGVPSTAEPLDVRYNLDIHIPSADYPVPEPPVQIPFVPDLWNSSKIEKVSAPTVMPPSTDPKVVVVAGEDTHPGGGPSHKVYVPSASTESTPSRPLAPPQEPATQLGRLVAGMADDLSLPVPSLPTFNFATGERSSHGHTRPMNEGEKRGLWVLLGVLVGSWTVAGVLSPTSEWAHKAEEHPHGEEKSP